MIILSKYGLKYTCFSCGCKFYDLNRPEAICPKCKIDQKERPKDYEEDEVETNTQREEELETTADEVKEVDGGYTDKDFMVNEGEEEADGDGKKAKVNIEFYDDDESNDLIKDQ